MVAIHPSVELLEERNTPSTAPTASATAPANSGAPFPEPASTSLVSAPIGNNGGSSTTNAVPTNGPGAGTMPGLPPGTNNPGSIYPNSVPGTTNLLPGPFPQPVQPNQTQPLPANAVLFNQFPTFSSAEVSTNSFLRLTYNFGIGDGSFIDARVPAANRPTPRVNLRVSQTTPVEPVPTLTSVELPAADDAPVEAPPDE